MILVILFECLLLIFRLLLCWPLSLAANCVSIACLRIVCVRIACVRIVCVRAQRWLGLARSPSIGALHARGSDGPSSLQTVTVYCKRRVCSTAADERLQCTANWRAWHCCGTALCLYVCLICMPYMYA